MDAEVKPEILQDKYRGCLLGAEIGDALGAQVEFKGRGEFEPVTDMVGGGPHELLPGQWTDDTSMTLCLAASLIEQNRYDPCDQMNRFCKWVEQGYMSSTGVCFDVGKTILHALVGYEKTGNPYSGLKSEFSKGNGSLMRIAPIAMFFFPDLDTIVQYAGDHSRLTHDTIECIEACELFCTMLWRAFSGMRKEEILFSDISRLCLTSPEIISVAKGDYRLKDDSQITGSGFVVRSIEAALWSFFHSSSYKGAVLTAVNLGDDADTTASICGQLAGAFYGERSIPSEWIEKLSGKEMIISCADYLAQR